MSVTEDWLNDEKFDFDVTSSPALLAESSITEEKSDEDDEEVFFGPQTFKEKVVATVVKEKELGDQPLQVLNPEQQALMLRESALLGLRIKHGNTPTRASPVAIVHPMKRDQPKDEQISLKDMLTKNKENNKENVNSKILFKDNIVPNVTDINKLKVNKILQQKLSNVKARPVSQPELATTSKLPMARNRGKSNLEFSEQLVDHASLYGLSVDTNKLKGSVRRRSGVLPIKKVQSIDLSTTSSKPSIPSLLPTSAIPSIRSAKVAQQQQTHHGSKLKPVKAIPQSQLRLPTSRKSIASQGTPNKPLKAGSSSTCTGLVKRNISATKNLSSATPSNVGIQQCRTVEAYGRQATRSLNDLTTPLNNSTRKSIVGRQLLAKAKPRSASPTPSNQSNTKRPTVRQTTPNNDRPSTPNERPTTPLNDTTHSLSEENQSLPSHADILNRYKKLKTAKRTESLESKRELEAEDNVVRKSPDTNGDANVNNNDNMSNKDSLEHGNDHINKVTTADCEVIPAECEVTNNGDNYTDPTDLSTPLVDLHVDETSPVKGCVFFMDPFATGETPPPLIDIGDVLEPEKPNEVLLIEF